LSELAKYKFLGYAYFILAFCMIGLSIAGFVQGLKIQFAGETIAAFLFYFSTPIIIFVSYFYFKKARQKLHVVDISS